MKTESSTVLVTGGTGLIGANVARSLVEAGCRPILFDYAPAERNVADIHDKVVIERGDVGDMTDLVLAVQRHRVDRIIHLAAVLLIEAVAKPAQSIATNCVGTSHLIQLTKAFGMKRMVYASSISVYGTRSVYEPMLGRGVVNEDDPPAPNNLYGSTKLLCEGLGLQATREGLDVVGLRPVVTYGLGRLTGGSGILNAAMRDAALTGRGFVTQPWLPEARLNTMYAKDCGEMFVRACLHEGRLKRHVYNMGAGEYYSVREMMAFAEKSLPSGAKIEFVPPPTDGGALPALDLPDVDSSAIRDELGFKPRYSFESAARECIEAYKAGAT